MNDMRQPPRGRTGETVYDRSAEFVQEEGVVESPDSGALAILNTSEINQQIATAKKWPRSIKQFIDEATEMATLDEATAEECIYALPRDGKVIEGPSARLAEIVMSAWGNCRAGARVVSEDDRFVTAQGFFYDLQRNVAISYEVKRRITDRNGRRYKDDMIGVTSNACCSVALRNAVFKGVPKAFWARIYDRTRMVVAGDAQTLANRRAKAIESFQIYGVKLEDILRVLEVKGVEDITMDHLVTLHGLYTAIKEGETTPEQAFAPQSPNQDASAASKTATNLHDIKNRYAENNAAQPGGSQASAPVNQPAEASAQNPPPPAESATGPATSTPPAQFNAAAAVDKIAEHQRSQHSTRHDEPAQGSTEGHGLPGVFDDSRARGRRR